MFVEPVVTGTPISKDFPAASDMIFTETSCIAFPLMVPVNLSEVLFAKSMSILKYELRLEFVLFIFRACVWIVPSVKWRLPLEMFKFVSANKVLAPK